MSYLVLARKWRPTSFAEVIGQEGVVRTLKNAIEQGRVAHAYLFTGARGVGKTTVARLLAKALNCEKGPTSEPDVHCPRCEEITRGSSQDVLEIDGASNTGVDDVRSLRDNSQYMPAKSRFKIYIIDEVHMLSTSAFNALLKILEEPPPHVKFIFATTEPHKIPLTVLSRCQRFDFKRVTTDAIVGHLERILQSEGARIDPAGLRLIARQAGGSIRDSLSLTDQVLAFGGEAIDLEQVRQALGLSGSEGFEAVIADVLGRRPDALMHTVYRLFNEGHDLERFLAGLIEHVHQLILFRSLEDVGELVDLLPEERDRLAAQASQAEPLRWHQVFDVLGRAATDMPRHPFPRLVLETALLRLATLEEVQSVGELLRRVERLGEQLAAAPAPPARNAPLRAPQAQKAPKAPAPKMPAPPEPVPERTVPDTALEGALAWEKLVAFVTRERPTLGALLSHACTRQAGAGQLQLAVEPGSFFADQLRAPRNLEALARLSAEFFGCPTEVQIEDLAAQDGPSLAASREQAAQEKAEDLRKRALEHPMVQEAIRVFGAEVEQIKTREEV